MSTRRRCPNPPAVAAALSALAAFAPAPERASAEAPLARAAGERASSQLPSVFLLGPLSSERFEQITRAARDKHNLWHRAHEPRTYEDLLENPANPFGRRAGDLLVLLLTLEPEGRLPAEHEDLLPSPWSKLRARLARGESIEESGTRRDLQVLVLGALDRAKLEALVLGSKRLAALLGSPLDPAVGRPSLFVLGPLGGERFEQLARAAKEKRSVWGRSHERRTYEDLFESPSNPFDRRKGDLLVLLLSLEPDGQLPKRYEDLLPSPWSKLRARLQRGESIEDSGTERGLQVLVLGAQDRVRLEALVLGSKRLEALLGSPLDPAAGRPPSLFVLGPLSPERFEELAKTAKQVHDVWGRSHERRTYEELFANPANPFDRRAGDLLVLLLSLESDGRLPEEYEDLLPSPWPEIQARLQHGETFEAEGAARELRVLALAAPKRADLESLVRRSERLALLLASSGGHK